jgi:hypothetical protein
MPSREQLFDHLTADLAVYRPELVGYVKCPFCLRDFSRAAFDIDEHGTKLTLDHVIPGSLKGKAFTLTCKSCNNAHGSKFDSHLSRMTNVSNALTGDSSKPISSRMSMDGARVPVGYFIEHTPDGKQVNTLVIRKSNPKDRDHLITALRNGTLGEFKLSMNFNYMPDRANMALVRIAYLGMFDSLGYRYVFGPGGDAIRRLIMEEIEPGTKVDQMVSQFRDLKNHRNLTQLHSHDSV